MLAADRSAAEVARVLRLPGSHNSKSGKWKQVRVIDELSSWRSYSVDALDGWIETTDPVLTYKEVPPEAKAVVRVTSNPFQELANETRALTSKSEMSIEEWLDAMVFHSVHGHGIDDTIAHVAGAMAAQRATLEETIDVLLEPMRLAFERGRKRDDGQWNERKARRNIADKYRPFKRKDEKRNG
jgi:hypothetical protein